METTTGTPAPRSAWSPLRQRLFRALWLANLVSFVGTWISLRRKQIAVAMSGNVTMLIWLGKQHLAQQDRVIVDAEEGREDIHRLGDAGDAAKEAG